MPAYKYIFGPVVSGRLGLSLGLDCIGETKTCTLDCMYCEVGPTKRMTLERAEYAPAGEILGELGRWREETGRTPDYLTLGGRGEPCLNVNMAEIIQGARRIFPEVPVAVLTNSTLLFDPGVRRDLALADCVLPSMDSLVEDEFKAVNRPHPKLRLDSMAEDLTTFRNSYSGKIYLEVLLVSGVNNTPGNLQRLERYVRELQPDRVDVATMTRPGTSNKAAPVEPEELARWREALHAKQIIRKSSDLRTKDIFQTENLERIREMVLSSISRRPQTADDLARALAVSHSDVERVLTGLVQQGKARITWGKEQAFYGTC